MELSLDLHVLHVVNVDELDESSEGNMDWHTEVVSGWESKDCWDLKQMLTEMEGLLEMDWDSIAELGESLGLEELNPLFQSVFVKREKTLNFVLDLDVEFAFNLLGLFTLIDSQDFTDMSNVFMSLTAGS